MKRIASKHDIYYITQRPLAVKFVTDTFMRRYDFPNPDEIYHTRDKRVEVRRLGIEIYLEDRADIARTLQNITKVVLFRQPWNYGFENEFTSVCSLQEFEELIERNCE